VLAARVVGSLIAFAIQRTARVKVAYNVAAYAFEVALGGFVLHAIWGSLMSLILLMHGSLGVGLLALAGAMVAMATATKGCTGVIRRWRWSMILSSTAKLPIASTNLPPGC
jgi:hypothetical protein